MSSEWEREDAFWVRLGPADQELYSWITQDIKEAMVAKPQHTLPMILYTDDDDCAELLPQKLDDNVCYRDGEGESDNGNVGDHHASLTGDARCALENLNSKRCRVPSLDGPDEGQREVSLDGNENTVTHHTSKHPDRRTVKHGVLHRRTVSFCDEVIVYLFDQENPTRPSLSSASFDEPPSTPSSCPDYHQDLALDHGFEWEDDITALAWARPAKANCHRGRRHSDPSPQRLHSPSQQESPQRYQLRKTCLVLTHVPESDLEDLGL